MDGPPLALLLPMMDDTLIRLILLRAFNCAQQHRIYGGRVHFDNEPLNAAADYKVTHTLEAYSHPRYSHV